MRKSRDGSCGLTFERVNSLLSYDLDSGCFRWKVSIRGKNSPGDIAGSPHSGGYWFIGIDGYQYLAQRLAWLLVTGNWPPSEIEMDHENRIKSDNRWVNLRLATHSQNTTNTAIRKDNKTGFKGVSFCKQKNKYHAMAHKDGKRVHVGFFDDPAVAHAAYCQKSKQLHGEFHDAGVSRG